MADKLIIFDTTLRDGEQSPGASMTKDEKLRIARQLERLKVDVIEAGFAASSNGDFEAVQQIANAIKDSTICSLSRANDRDIARAAEALKGANRARIHTFIATSALHMEKKLRIARQLERLKVDVIEAGFAASSNGDFEAVQMIANAIKDSTICSLSRANDRDIARAAEALKGANSARIHTFIATSALHMEKKLRMSPEQVLEQAKQSVRFARNLVGDIEFSPKTATAATPIFCVV